MKKIIFGSLILLIAFGLYYYFELRRINFPDFEYDHAVALSIDRTVLDTASQETIEYRLLPFGDNGTDGQSFLDKYGNPIHSYYSKKLISPEQISEIHNCLYPPGISGERKTDCSPVYRDVVVYYDKLNKPMGWISICFECRKIYFLPNRKNISNTAFNCLEDLFKTL